MRTNVQYVMVVLGLLLVLTGPALVSQTYTERTQLDGVVVVNEATRSHKPDKGHAAKFNLYSA